MIFSINSTLIFTIFQMDSAFAKINDPNENERKNQLSGSVPSTINTELIPVTDSTPQSTDNAPPNTQTSTPDNVPKSSFSFISIIKYFVIIVVVVVVVCVIIYVITRSTKIELNNAYKEIEAMRRSETVLKTKINSYENDIRKLRSQTSSPQRSVQFDMPNIESGYVNQSDPNLYQHSFREENLPTDSDFDAPTEYEPNVKRKPDPRITKKEEIKALVNKPRKTVEDMQKEVATRNEQRRVEQEAKIQEELDAKTNAKAFREHDMKTNDAIFNAVAESGGLIE